MKENQLIKSKGQMYLGNTQLLTHMKLLQKLSPASTYPAI